MRQWNDNKRRVWNEAKGAVPWGAHSRPGWGAPSPPWCWGHPYSESVPADPASAVGLCTVTVATFLGKSWRKMNSTWKKPFRCGYGSAGRRPIWHVQDSGSSPWPKPDYWFLVERVWAFFLDAHRITKMKGSMTALLADLMMCLIGLLINDLAKKKKITLWLQRVQISLCSDTETISHLVDKRPEGVCWPGMMRWLLPEQKPGVSPHHGKCWILIHCGLYECYLLKQTNPKFFSSQWPWWTQAVEFVKRNVLFPLFFPSVNCYWVWRS